MRLLSVVAAAFLLAGCSQAQLAANGPSMPPAQPFVERVMAVEETATLTFTGASVPPLDKLCLLVGSDSDDVGSLDSGQIRLTWEEQAVPVELQLDVIGVQTTTAAGRSPVFAEWTPLTGPGAFPFRVEIGLADSTAAMQLELQFWLRLETWAADISVLEGSCG